MDRLSLEPQDGPDPVAPLDALLAVARGILAGADPLASADLRAFAARVEAGEDLLGDRYTAIRSTTERRGIGAILTPPGIVDAMLRWVRAEASTSGEPVTIVDPGAGTGRFSMAAARAFPAARVIAVENDPDLLVLLRANLRVAGLADRVAVADTDFRSLVLEPSKGPTLFLGNPPYVRHHCIGAEWKRWYAEICASQGIAASKLAGLHLHFFAKIAAIGKNGDYGCLITSAEWLDVGYGAALRSLLANGLGGVEIHILRPAAEAFPGTMTTAAITGFRIGRRPKNLRVRTAESPSELERLEGGRAVCWSEASESRKWSLLVRDAPRPPAGTIELGELCRVHRGQVTGANRVWIAGDHAGGLPAEFLKPTITRAEELIAAEPLLDHHGHLARVVDLPASLDQIEGDQRIAVERFIAWARTIGAADGYIAQHRRPWWAVRLREPAPIVCTYMARRSPAFVRNRANVHLLNIAHGIYPRDPMSESQLMALVAVLRSTVTQQGGRVYAGGLVKFEPRELERIPLPGFASSPIDAATPVASYD